MWLKMGLSGIFLKWKRHISIQKLGNLSACPSVHHTLRYRVCIINFSYSFQWNFLKSWVLVVDIMKFLI